MIALVLLPPLLTACSTSSTRTDYSKLGTLASSLGPTAQQAQGGPGSMFVIAQQRLATAGDLTTVKYIPEADRQVGVARHLSVYDQASTTATATTIGTPPDGRRRHRLPPRAACTSRTSSCSQRMMRQ
jgi:hypothetical protein